MAVLDIILLKELITTPVTVNSSYESEIIDISFTENDFSIQLVYDGGIDVDMEVFIAVSNDKVNFPRIPLSAQAIEDDSGSIVFDVASSGAVYMRVEIDVNGGSIDLQKISYRAKRRH
jgi:hypothetical protein